MPGRATDRGPVRVRDWRALPSLTPLFILGDLVPPIIETNLSARARVLEAEAEG